MLGQRVPGGRRVRAQHFAGLDTRLEAAQLVCEPGRVVLSADLSRQNAEVAERRVLDEFDGDLCTATSRRLGVRRRVVVQIPRGFDLRAPAASRK